MLICRVGRRLHQVRADQQKLRCCISSQRLQQRCCHHSRSAMPSRGSLSGLEIALWLVQATRCRRLVPLYQPAASQLDLK